MSRLKLISWLILAVMITNCQSTSSFSEKSSGESSGASEYPIVDSLLSQMTLEEKIGQMNQYSVGSELTGPNGATEHAEIYEQMINGQVGSVLNLVGAEETRKLQELVVNKTRLGIPLIFSYDVIHGYQTMFPIPLAESGSWDLDLMELSARVAAEEAAAAGIQWTFAPMVDVGRDPRWGRVMEGAGEDPYLGSLIAQARIRGFQGENLAHHNTIAACAKHFAGYAFAESGKDYNSVNVGNRLLHNVILPPFRASIQSNVATFMNAFNDIDGIPSTGNHYLLRDLLEDKWQYDGVVVSDWNSIGEMINHGTVRDLEHASEVAANAGCDVDMMASGYVKHLKSLIEAGKVSNKVVDQAVRQILELKVKLGLFEDPYRYMDLEREKQTLGSESNRKAARKVAAESIVLLKNDKNLLPISKIRNLGVIGPLAKDRDSPLGNWRAKAKSGSAVSLYEGLTARLGNKMKISYAEGCKLSIGSNTFHQELVIEEKDKSDFAEAINVAKSSELIIMALGEPAYMSGEARSKAEIGLPGVQLDLLKAIYEVNPNIVLVLMNGRPLVIPWEAKNIPAILETWHLGSEAGHAIADVISGDINPSGKLTMTFPRDEGQIPIYYNHNNTGRPSSELIFYAHYMDLPNTPLYPFGYGLSYTEFSYSDFKVRKKGEEIHASVRVTNTGNLKGKEVVQLYIRDVVASVVRPVLELKSFKKIELAHAESREVNFVLTKSDLCFLDHQGNQIFEPGEFQISVGSNSVERLSSTINFE